MFPLRSCRGMVMVMVMVIGTCAGAGCFDVGGPACGACRPRRALRSLTSQVSRITSVRFGRPNLTYQPGSVSCSMLQCIRVIRDITSAETLCRMGCPEVRCRPMCLWWCRCCPTQSQSAPVRAAARTCTSVHFCSHSSASVRDGVPAVVEMAMQPKRMMSRLGCTAMLELPQDLQS